jgi:putative radical SAM enzyme (TIGR03279 family)
MAFVMLQIDSVQEGSLAGELGLEPGAQLVSINGRDLNDFLDWEYLTADDFFTLVARTPDGRVVEYEVARPEGLPLGVDLAPPEVIVCSNRCDFCFVKGNPKGLRRALYVRDDDYRLSFRYGNFVTLTNLQQKDIDRIVEYRLTPLYVSVHASTLEVRRRLLGNPKAPDVIEQLHVLGEQGIECHTQIVLQPGINDGSALIRTLDDLYELGDNVLSVSVVPVGLTSRNQRSPVRKPSADECREAIVAVDTVAARALEGRGKYWAYGSDELYLGAGCTLPPAGRYDDFEQLENGVGVVRYFQLQIRGFEADLSDVTIGVATGTAMGALFPDILAELVTRTGATFELLVLTNDLFGPSVTTAGLLPGRSFASALAGRRDLDLALIPVETLNDDGVFLDDLSFSELEEQCAMELRVSHWLVDALGEVSQ